MSYDDQYDDEEEADDSDAFVRATNGYVGDAEALLRRALDIIATAPTMPLSSSPRIDRDGAQRQMSAQRLSFMNESRRLDNTRLKLELRLRLRYPTVRQGLAT